MKHARGGFLSSEFDALERNEALLLLIQCVAQLPPTLKKVLAMHYDENLPIADIAACCGLTEFEIDQIHAKTLEVLQTMVAAELGLAVLRQADAKWTTPQSPRQRQNRKTLALNEDTLSTNRSSYERKRIWQGVRPPLKNGD